MLLDMVRGYFTVCDVCSSDFSRTGAEAFTTSRKPEIRHLNHALGMVQLSLTVWANAPRRVIEGSLNRPGQVRTDKIYAILQTIDSMSLTQSITKVILTI